MRIVLISDTHLAAHAAAFMANGRAAVRWINAARPDLVVHLGDVTADAVKDPAQFEAARAVLADIAAPLRLVPGNHDVGDAPPRGGREEPALDLERLAQFRAALGEDRWVVRQAGWTLVGLNAQLFGHPEAEAAQWAWLDAQLATAQGPFGLFVHKPLTQPGLPPDEDNPRFAPPAARRAVAERFAGRDLRFVASGHVHQALQQRIDGVARLWAPSSAFILPDAVQPLVGRKVVGLMLLDLGGGDPQAEVVVPEGVESHDVLDHPEVYPQVRDLPGVHGDRA